MAFSASSDSVKLEDGRFLAADCLSRDGNRKHSRLDLNRHIGNREGSFDLKGHSFAASARKIRLEGTVLHAELRSSKGSWSPDAINLDVIVSNEDGNLRIVKNVDLSVARRPPRPASPRVSSTPRVAEGPPRCQLCQDWSVPSNYEGRVQSNKAIVIRPSDLSSGKRRKGCASCALAERILQEMAPELFKSHKVRPERLTLQLSPRLFKSNTRPAFEVKLSNPNGGDESIKCFVHTVPGEDNSSQTFGNISNAHLLRGDSNSQQSLRKARTWLDTCASKHQKCPRSAKSQLPTRILDIGTSSNDPVKLLTTAPMKPATYACLSHCWGKTQTLLLTRENHDRLHQSVPWRDLQSTYTDAIELCRGLGIRHIWIDTLCIVQDSPEDWKAESGKMHAYYGNCFVCIAATSAADHDGGCRVRPLTVKHTGTGDDGLPYAVYARPQIPHIVHSTAYPHPTFFPLLTRAWVYQERRLSPRVLHVTDAELFFECAATTHCECGGKDGGNYTVAAWTKAEETYFASHRRVNEMEEGPVKGEHEWRSHVHAYSALDLTKRSDRLPALSGLAQWSRRRREELGRDPGRYLAGCWEGTLVDDISWVVGHQLTRLQVDRGGAFRGMPGLYAPGDDRKAVFEKQGGYVAPSWSWASVADGVNYAPYGFEEVLCRVEDVRVETEGADPYGQVKGGRMVVSGKTRPTRWATEKAFWNGPRTYLSDISGTQRTFLGLKRDKGLRWWRDWKDGDGTRLKTDEWLYVMPLGSRKVYSNKEGAEFHLKWMPGLLTVTETAYLVLMHVEGGGNSGVYERVGWASYSGASGGPDFGGVEMGRLTLI